MEIVNNVEKHVTDPRFGDVFYRPKTKSYYILMSVDGNMMLMDIGGRYHLPVGTIGELTKGIEDSMFIHYTDSMYKLELNRR